MKCKSIDVINFAVNIIWNFLIYSRAYVVFQTIESLLSKKIFLNMEVSPTSLSFFFF
jgi:hypothetical protein